MASKFSRKVSEKKKTVSFAKKESNMPDPRKSPFFIKQFKMAKEFMKKHPVPLELLPIK
ncbi:hypothetical protein [Chitinophaga sp.]|uniref:hypothetical protein n=1 Tax=Chitinophaga sp. TaxID=1869181 RepID=UPI0031DD9628